MNRLTRFRRLAVATSATTFALIAVGGLVRATGSGDACPTWPGCYPGRFLPLAETHALIEWTHRTLVIVLTILIGTLAVTALRTARTKRAIWIPAVASLGIVFVQAGIGAARIVNPQNRALINTVHLTIAMLLVGAILTTTINAYCLRRTRPEPASTRTFAHLASVAAAGTLLLIVVGGYVRGLGAGLAFSDWPLMGGRILPEAGRLATPHFVHRLLALVVGMLVVALAWRARRREQPEAAIKAFSTAAAGLFLAQILAGAINVWTDLSAPAIVIHVTLSALTWGATLSLAIVASNLSKPATAAIGDPAHSEAILDPANSGAILDRGDSATDGGSKASSRRTGHGAATPGPAHFGAHLGSKASSRGRGIRATVSVYVRLTKPRIIELLLVTTVPAMVVAKGGWPGLGLTLATLCGGTLAAGGANAINCYIDRDIDAKMGRTAARPLPSGSVEPTRALEFGIALGILAFAYLWWAVNLLSASLAIAALLFYVFVYTIGLKRHTPQNIVIGGAAGAVPVLVGWAAVTGSLTWAPVLMFAIIFFWTPPHFWALSLKFAKDYQRAGVPMLPVVAGPRETHRQILLYSFVLVAVTLAFAPIGRMGAIYLASAVGLGAWFIRMAAALWRRGTDKAAMSLFKYSINYLAALFAAMAIDTAFKIA